MVRSEKTEKPDQPEGLEFTDNSRGRSILRAIKKHLDEQPTGVSRRGAIQTYVVVDKGIISDKGFKNYLNQFLKEVEKENTRLNFLVINGKFKSILDRPM